MKNKLLTVLSVFVLLVSVSVKTPAQSDKTIVMATAKKVVLALNGKDMKTLSQYVHPTKGVRFSPYGYINKESDLVFKKGQVPRLILLRRTYLWGEHDGSGDKINLGFPDYYEAFIYDRNFARAPQISFNKQIGNGNTLVNIREAYPNGKFVEYHFPKGADGNEMGWRSLRLIFEKSGAIWYLVGISHDQWTI